MNNRRPGVLPFFIIFIVLVVLLAAMMHSGQTAKTSDLSYAEVVDLFTEEQVASFTVDGSTMELVLQDGSVKYHELESVSDFRQELDSLIYEQYQKGIITDYDYQAAAETPMWLTLLPIVLGAALLIFLIFMLTGRLQGGQGGPGGMASFGKANVRSGATKDGQKVTFRDVAGADEEKAELEEVVDFLQNPAKYLAVGAKIPKGILLVGPPGTGKTLLAKAVAGEAGVEFLSISGSDFVEMYVGVGASRVRDLFEQAKKAAPAIIFIDEIDAVGRKRGAGFGGGHDEREQTLNQLLVEMDGFVSNSGVIVMAATNRKDILDPALLRPGRFDRQVYVGKPDLKGREAILQVHARTRCLGSDVDLHRIAAATAGFTGADLSNLLNEGALLAARSSRQVVTMPDLEEAMLKIIAGPEKKSHLVSEREKKLTAVHEAGHAVAMYCLPTHDPVHQITIVPRGGAGGMTIALPEEDRSYMSRNEMYEQIVSLLGGRVAEALKLGDISTGASNDIQRATELARDMVARYGMSARLGAVSYDSDTEVFLGRDYEKTRAYSEQTAGTIDSEMQALMAQAYEKCEQLLRSHDDALMRVADFLMANETMSRDQFEAAMRNEAIPESAGRSLFDSTAE